MFVKLIRKDGKGEVFVNTSSIDTFGVDSDGTGTMIILHSGTIRCVQEDIAVIKAAVGISDLAASKKAKK